MGALAVSNPPIVCLPGLGANARLFAALVEQGATVPAWPEPNTPGLATGDLATYADRVRDNLIAQSLWHGAIIVGFSFGGQVALSAAARAAARAADQGLPMPRGIVLVSAPRRSDAIVARFRRQVALSRPLPGRLIAWAAERLVADRFALACGLDEPQRRELRAMAAELDVPLFKRQAQLAARWHFSAADEQSIREAGTAIEHVHAERDPVIPAPSSDVPGVVRVPGRAHLLTWTHAALVDDAIARAAGHR